VRRLYLCRLMRRLLVRRSLTAVGIYSSVALGFLATVIAARRFHSADVFGLYTIVIAASGFFQILLDLTVEEAVVKFGFRYVAREDWGRLRELYRQALAVKLVGAAVGTAALLVLAPFGDSLFGHAGLQTALFVSAGIPIGQALEGLAGTALFLRGRYDIRSAFLIWSMLLRLVALWFATPHGLVTAVTAVVLAQAVSTGSVAIAGLAAFRRFPAAPKTPLGSDRREIVSFVVQSSAASGVVSVRNYLTPLLLGIATTPRQVAYFNVARAPQSGFQALSAPARMVLLTEQTRDWEHGRQSVVMRGIRNYSALAALLMVVAVPPLYYWMPDLVRLVYHARFVGAANAARVFLFAAAVQFLVGWTKSFPVTIGRPQLRWMTHGAEALVVIPLTVVLGLAWGATGAAAAVLAGTCVFAALWAVIAMRVEAVDAVTS
jgi:O-antigen/teichoic acid export membrane protein